jgi:hypothetical protein
LARAPFGYTARALIVGGNTCVRRGAPEAAAAGAVVVPSGGRAGPGRNHDAGILLCCAAAASRRKAWIHMKVPRSLQPLIDDGIIDSVIRRLRSGKEASVFIVDCRGELRCAEVYKDAEHRGFHRLAE